MKGNITGEDPPLEVPFEVAMMEAELNSLDKAIFQTNEALRELKERLGPVLGESLPSSGRPESDPETEGRTPPNSPLGTELRSLAHLAQLMAANVRSQAADIRELTRWLQI